MRRILSAILALTLVLALCSIAYAAEDEHDTDTDTELSAAAEDVSDAATTADVHQFSDLTNHWALPYIEQIVGLELMKGISATTFSPDTGMTRAMFVTVLGRFAEINPDAWKMNYDGVLFSDVKDTAYYSSYVNWAARTGITNGIGNGKFNPDGMITREQMLTMLKRFADLTGKTFEAVSILGVEDIAETEEKPFSDEADISAWAKEAVEQLRSCGIIQGMKNEDGSFRFVPKKNATRAEAAAVFCRMKGVIASKANWSENYVTLIMVDKSASTLVKGDSLTLKAQLFPKDATNTNICWISSNPSVATVEKSSEFECVVNWVGVGSCTIYAYSVNGCKTTCELVCENPPAAPALREAAEFVPQDLSLAYQGESTAQKMERIFGGVFSDARTVYSSDEEARPNMVTVTVPVWDINETGGKYTRQISLEVHRNIAATVDQIFREIYACPARYPINSLGGYRYESMSEHNCGLAIDVSPNENPYCSPDGSVLVGSFFSPETNEYSIPVGGEIDQIFAKYGFTRGIYWRSGYKDYMHYSFFGT